MRDRRITNADFRPCSIGRSRSQAPLYVCARVARLPTGPRVPWRSSVTVWEETAPVKLPDEHGPGCWAAGEDGRDLRVVFHRWLPAGWRRRIAASHLCYTEIA